MSAVEASCRAVGDMSPKVLRDAWLGPASDVSVRRGGGGRLNGVSCIKFFFWIAFGRFLRALWCWWVRIVVVWCVSCAVFPGVCLAWTVVPRPVTRYQTGSPPATYDAGQSSAGATASVFCTPAPWVVSSYTNYSYDCVNTVTNAHQTGSIYSFVFYSGCPLGYAYDAGSSMCNSVPGAFPFDFPTLAETVSFLPWQLAVLWVGAMALLVVFVVAQVSFVNYVSRGYSGSKGKRGDDRF